ncbi:MAG: MOSC domain-containing protein [Chloroflexi bacterium]|nr:MOSC domain-containing protein [Chloroflexota bacterium]
MLTVAALYRYPVKGFTAESCRTLSVSEDGRVAGDRVLGVRFADSPAPDDAWGPKAGMLALVNTPGLARLRLAFDTRANRIRICLGQDTLVEATLDEAGRRRIATALARYVLALDESPLARHPERLPLRVIGDGIRPRYHDSEAGTVTLHGRGSLQALAADLGGAQVSELRFRSNVAVEGLEAWEEQAWVGRRVRIGDLDFDVIRSKTRCLATHANPDTGERDLPVLSGLIHAFGQDQPTFAVALLPAAGAGQIHVGDPVRLHEG